MGKKRTGEGLSPGQAAWLGYFCGVLWYLGNCYWIFETIHLYEGLDPFTAGAILLLFSLYLGLYHGLFAWMFSVVSRRWGARRALAAVPLLWVATELARAKVTGFPWDLLGYAQVDNPLLTKLAPVGGVMLISAVIAGVGALLAQGFVIGSGKRRGRILGGAVLVAAMLEGGVAWPVARDPAGKTATLLQENLLVGSAGRRVEDLSAGEKYRQFIALSLRPVSAMDGEAVAAKVGEKPAFIIWPEAPADFATSDPLFRAEVSGLARATGTTVISGAVGVDFDRSTEQGYREYGSAAVFDGEGNYVGRYDKVHRVPWGEYVPFKKVFFFAGKLVQGVGNMEAGSRHTLFAKGREKFGIFICYESIFGDEVREFVKDGATVLVNISDDGWYGDSGAPWQHLDMERMRAMENRRWILRDTNTGVTTAVDPHGRGTFTTPRHVRAAYSFAFDYRSDVTFYTRFGEWFAWMCVGMSGVLLVPGLRRRAVH